MYQQKYLKYKNKYLRLKNYIGGHNKYEIDDIVFYNKIQSKILDVIEDGYAYKIQELVKPNIIHLRVTEQELSGYTHLENKYHRLKKPIDLSLENDLIEQINLQKYNNCPNKFIEIDDYIFYIKAYDLHAIDNRGVVVLKSIHKTDKSLQNIFTVTRSHSECGFWRLCVLDSTSQKLFKGNDYVQTTFINLTLQNFINQNITKCNVRNKDIMCTDNHTNILTNLPITKTSLVFQLLPRRISPVNGKLLLNIDMVKNLTAVSNFMKKKTDTWAIKEKNVELIHKFKGNVEDDILHITGKVIKIIFMNNLILYVYKYKLLVERSKLPKQINYPRLSDKDPYTNTGNIYHKFTPEFGNTTTDFKKEGVVGISLQEPGAKILNNGLNSNFVSAHGFIYKIFDYFFQVPYNETDVLWKRGEILGIYTLDIDTLDTNTPKETRVAAQYLYIGDRTKDIYPFTEVEDITLDDLTL
jgi:hypothetical protein